MHACMRERDSAEGVPAQVGLSYICATAERFFAVSAVLNTMVAALPEQPSVRLLKHIIRCYLRLSDNSRAREALRQCLPPLLLDAGFTACLKDDGQTRGCATTTLRLTDFMCLMTLAYAQQPVACGCHLLTVALREPTPGDSVLIGHAIENSCRAAAGSGRASCISWPCQCPAGG